MSRQENRHHYIILKEFSQSEAFPRRFSPNQGQSNPTLAPS
uniref:Uncharacterized protein n=1 Tax=Anguilla anguilla TaxID=7936 RepID=A0A0E9TNE2_ANGAN